MDIKTRIEDETIFCGKNRNKRIANLNAKGIYTVEDFINSDIDTLTTTSYVRKQYRAFAEILKYKYQGVPLNLDVLLIVEFSAKEIETYSGPYPYDLERLGFAGYHFPAIETRLVKIEKREQIMMIDILREVATRSPVYQNLAQFYVDYYENELQKDNNIEKDKDYIEKLRDELVRLCNRRDELDAQISTLKQEISSLEGGSATYGGK